MCYECFTSGLRVCYGCYKCVASDIRGQMSGVTCYVSHVMCQVSHVIFFSVKVAELVGGGSVINGTYPV